MDFLMGFFRFSIIFIGNVMERIYKPFTKCNMFHMKLF